MKIAPRQLGAFLAKPDPAVRVALVYGPDGGQVRETAKALLLQVVDDPKDPFRIAELTAADLKADPARLSDEVGALSFTGGRRVVRLRDAGNWAADAVNAVLDDVREIDSLVLVEAGELAPRDRLRKICDSHAAAASIACYVDDDRTLDQVIAEGLRTFGLSIDPAAQALLVDSLGADRGVTRQELEKLALYKAGGDGVVTLADVEACVGDGASLVRDDVALATLSGDQGGLDAALTRCWQAGESAIGILRTVQRHLQRLHLLAVRRAAGANVEEAMKRLRPPVFFKHQPIVRGQLQLWSPRTLVQAMTIVTEAEVNCKSTGMPDRALCGRALVRIANAARSSDLRRA